MAGGPITTAIPPEDSRERADDGQHPADGAFVARIAGLYGVDFRESRRRRNVAFCYPGATPNTNENGLFERRWRQAIYVYHGNIQFMIAPNGIIGFEWDAGNARKNEKHGDSQSEAEEVFFDARLLVAPDLAHSMAEARHHALGTTLAGRHLHITFTLRASGTRIRVISARNMHRKERQIYDRKN